MLKIIRNVSFIIALILLVIIKINHLSYKDNQKININNQQEVSKNEENIVEFKPEKVQLPKQKKSIVEVKKPESKPNLIKFKVTAYDLSYQSCGKTRSNPAYGISRGGVNLRNQTINSKYIATDPKVIPLGTKVKMTFIDKNYKKYDGIYRSIDSGGAIKGRKIDLYFGENKYKECLSFGVTYALVEILKE